MKHKTWFRLVLKAIGIFLLATGAVAVVDAVSTAVGRAVITSGFGSGYGFLEVLAYALFGGKRCQDDLFGGRIANGNLFQYQPWPPAPGNGGERIRPSPLTPLPKGEGNRNVSFPS